jgi:hypothetical protein
MNSANRKKLGVSSPDAQAAGLEALLGGLPLVHRVVVDSTAAAGFNFTMPYGMKIAFMIVQAQAAATTGTLQLRRSTTAISDAVICAVNHVVTYIGTCDDAQAETAEGETLNFISTGDDATEAGKVRAIVYIFGSQV